MRRFRFWTKSTRRSIQRNYFLQLRRRHKRKLKLQIAEFFGQYLSGTIQPAAQQIRDVLAEIKTIRNQL